MHSTSELVGYLNDYFATEIWRPAGDLIGNVVVSEFDNQVRFQPLVNGLSNTRVTFAQPPRISKVDENAVRIRLPGNARHSIETDIVTTSPLPNVHVTIEILIELVAGRASPIPEFDIAVDISWGGGPVNALVGRLNPYALAAKRVLEEIIESFASGLLTDKLREKQSGLLTYRFDPSRDLVWADSSSRITDILDANFEGSKEPLARGYIDILLVADGYTVADIGEFDAFTDEARKYFANGDLEPPFRECKTAIRLWKMPLVADSFVDSLQRSVISVVTDRNTVNFANLARVAEIGLTARTFFRRDPIIVFASKIRTANTRASAQGPYVLLNRPEADVAVLIHELAHTPLGHYLADEYWNESTLKSYQGLEPRPRNVSANPLVGWHKWQPWSGSLLTSVPHVGAYEHARGIFRFADTCRMRTTSFGSFCDICREELTLGLLERGHAMAGTQGVQGMVDLKITYQSPWAGEVTHHIEGGDVAQLEVFADTGDTDRSTQPTRVNIEVVGSSVPKDWQITAGGIAGSTREMFVSPGSIIELVVRHQSAAISPLLAPDRPVPETSVRLEFSRERRLSDADFVAPSELIQSVSVGSVIRPAINPATGALSLPETLWVAANLGRIRGLDLLCSVQFQIEGPGSFAAVQSSNPGAAGEQRRWTFDGMPPIGQYVWSARTIWRRRGGRWIQARRGQNGYSFEVGAIPFDERRRPPANPFDLEIVETATFPALPVGLRASSWHPNDQPIKLRFQLKMQGVPWEPEAPNVLQALDTDYLHRDQSDFQTLAVTGRVFFDRLRPPSSNGDHYEWRVRAIDQRNQASDWIEGRPFAIYLPDRRPQSLEEFVKMLETLRPGLLDPRGPADVLRLFVVDDWPAPGEGTDFSELKKWQRPDRLVERDSESKIPKVRVRMRRLEQRKPGGNTPNLKLFP